MRIRECPVEAEADHLRVYPSLARLPKSVDRDDWLVSAIRYGCFDLIMAKGCPSLGYLQESGRAGRRRDGVDLL